MENSVEIRQVWNYNVDYELECMKYVLCKFPCNTISIDTEFPGTLFTSNQPYSHLSPQQYYSLMKKNVDQLQLIQLGLSLSDGFGIYRTSWQFNFSDFDPNVDPHNSDSIALLTKQGIDFPEFNRMGIDSCAFAQKFKILLSTVRYYKDLSWITFQGTYDFALMIKVLTRDELPADYEDFMALVNCYFGYRSYDLKLVMRKFGFRGGLEKLAASFGLGRIGGKSHQAGSDSLLTMQVWVKMYTDLLQRGQVPGFCQHLLGLTHVC